jgi:hypothetical protein
MQLDAIRKECATHFLTYWPGSGRVLNSEERHSLSWEGCLGTDNTLDFQAPLGMGPHSVTKVFLITLGWPPL